MPEARALLLALAATATAEGVRASLGAARELLLGRAQPQEGSAKARAQLPLLLGSMHACMHTCMHVEWLPRCMRCSCAWGSSKGVLPSMKEDEFIA